MQNLDGLVACEQLQGNWRNEYGAAEVYINKDFATVT